MNHSLVVLVCGVSPSVFVPIKCNKSVNPKLVGIPYRRGVSEYMIFFFFFSSPPFFLHNSCCVLLLCSLAGSISSFPSHPGGAAAPCRIYCATLAPRRRRIGSDPTFSGSRHLGTTCTLSCPCLKQPTRHLHSIESGERRFELGEMAVQSRLG